MMSERKKVRKAVIAAAGFGTRFLPQTKAMPKEMLPIVDKPIIQYVVEEAVASGIEDIILVTGYTKRSIEDHFDYINADLRANLRNSGKLELLEETKKISDLANFIYIRQKGPPGNGTAILNAKHVIGDEPFAVLWGDMITWSKNPRLKQCIEVYENHKAPVVSGARLEKKEDSRRYGVFDVEGTSDKYTYKMKNMIEKPEPEDAPSDLWADGCYVLTTEIFDELESLEPGKANEIWLADAIQRLAKKRDVYVRETDGGTAYDTSNSLDYLKIVVDFALMRDDIKDDFSKFLRGRIS